MEFKLGGGKHLQPYDPENGQYTNEDLVRIKEKDMENLVLIYIFGLDYDSFYIHFPNYKIHDNDYCKLFVKYIRTYIKNIDVVIEERKMNYLLKEVKSDDKSKFLLDLGYDFINTEILMDEIRWGTDFKTSKFRNISKYTFNIMTKTTLRGKIVTTGRQINEDGTVRFITLIPGGDKIWK